MRQIACIREGCSKQSRSLVPDRHWTPRVDSTWGVPFAPDSYSLLKEKPANYHREPRHRARPLTEAVNRRRRWDVQARVAQRTVPQFADLRQNVCGEAQVRRYASHRKAHASEVYMRCRQTRHLMVSFEGPSRGKITRNETGKLGSVQREAGGNLSTGPRSRLHPLMARPAPGGYCPELPPRSSRWILLLLAVAGMKIGELAEENKRLWSDALITSTRGLKSIGMHSSG